MRQHSAVLVDGGLGGGVGTVAMSLVMLGARRAGLAPGNSRLRAWRRRYSTPWACAPDHGGHGTCSR